MRQTDVSPVAAAGGALNNFLSSPSAGLDKLARSFLQDWEEYGLAPSPCACTLEKFPYYPDVSGLPTCPWVYVLADRLVGVVTEASDSDSPLSLPPLPPAEGYLEQEGIDATVAALLAAATPALKELMSLLADVAHPPCACPRESAVCDGSVLPESIGGSDAVGTPTPLVPDAALTQRIHTGLNDVLSALGVVGVRRLLRLRHTTGSAPLLHVLPPPRHCLLAAFTARHSPAMPLSVGARALSKHAHRATAGFWGTVRGPADTQNTYALGVISRVLDGGVWLNCHCLPHEATVFEVRQGEGYGARWAVDSRLFRGFLEPYMPGGHEVGWKH